MVIQNKWVLLRYQKHKKRADQNTPADRGLCQDLMSRAGSNRNLYSYKPKELVLSIERWGGFLVVGVSKRNEHCPQSTNKERTNTAAGCV